MRLSGVSIIKSLKYCIILCFMGSCILVGCVVFGKSGQENRQISSLISVIGFSPEDSGLSKRGCHEEPGVVKGILLENGRPVVDVRLYLGSVIKNMRDKSQVVTFDRTQSITTTTGDQGEFEFRNVPPGEYGLVLDTIMSSYLLFWPDNRGPILIFVTEEHGVCLGEIDFPDLPQP